MVEPEINVCITEDDKIVFDLSGSFYCAEIERVFYGLITARLIGDIIEISDGHGYIVKSSKFVFEPADYESDTFLLRNVKIGKSFHWERLENQRFQGSLKLQVFDGTLYSINTLPLEDYLLSVISSEMSATSSEELLRAHAIISRSWVLSQISKSKEELEIKKQSEQIKNENEILVWHDREEHDHFDVCADDHCQRYQGITKAYTKRVKRAIRDTRGIILEYQGKICDTRFSKCCGGISESFENVWENKEFSYLQSVDDYKFPADDFDLQFNNERNAERWIKSSPPAYCNTTDENILKQVLNDFDQGTDNFYRWQVSYSQDEIAGLVNEKTGIDFGEIIDLVPLERGKSSRLIKLKIVGTKHSMSVGKELEIRRILSKSHLLSSAFVVNKTDYVDSVPGKFTLFGAGWGHGVGLCQIGAAVMGAMGFKFDEILTHYFREASLKKIYE